MKSLFSGFSLSNIVSKFNLNDIAPENRTVPLLPSVSGNQMIVAAVQAQVYPVQTAVIRLNKLFSFFHISVRFLNMDQCLSAFERNMVLSETET